jgi:hypothetical protein
MTIVCLSTLPAAARLELINDFEKMQVCSVCQCQYKNKMENEVNNDFIGDTGDDQDDDDTSPPPLVARSHNVLQQLDDEVLSMRRNDDLFIGGTGDEDDQDDDDTSPPPLVARSHNVLQQLDDDVLNMRRRPWQAVLPFCVDRHDG